MTSNVSLSNTNEQTNLIKAKKKKKIDTKDKKQIHLDLKTRNQ
jgi:hypothetical protein